MTEKEVILFQAVAGALVQVPATVIASEKALETLLESDASLIGVNLMIIGRQVETNGHGYVDLLALDEHGHIWVIELKRHRTSRSVVAQIVDYGVWAETLSAGEVASIFAIYCPGVNLASAFEAHFGKPMPAEVNATQELVIVAGALDSQTRENVQYLQRFSVPIRTVLFEHFEVGGRILLACVREKLDAGFSRWAPPTATLEDSRTAGPVAPPSQISPRGARTRLHEYRDGIQPAHAQAKDFWARYRAQFQWDFLPPDFLFALHQKWQRDERSVGRPRLPFSRETLVQRLRDIVQGEDGWEYRQASPAHLMVAFEPLAKGIDWTWDGGNVPIRGFRRRGA
jgi:hypothetical protein